MDPSLSLGRPSLAMLQSMGIGDRGAFHVDTPDADGFADVIYKAPALSDKPSLKKQISGGLEYQTHMQVVRTEQAMIRREKLVADFARKVPDYKRIERHMGELLKEDVAATDLKWTMGTAKADQALTQVDREANQKLSLQLASAALKGVTALIDGGYQQLPNAPTAKAKVFFEALKAGLEESVAKATTTAATTTATTTTTTAGALQSQSSTGNSSANTPPVQTSRTWQAPKLQRSSTILQPTTPGAQGSQTSPQNRTTGLQRTPTRIQPSPQLVQEQLDDLGRALEKNRLEQVVVNGEKKADSEVALAKLKLVQMALEDQVKDLKKSLVARPVFGSRNTTTTVTPTPVSVTKSTTTTASTTPITTTTATTQPTPNAHASVPGTASPQKGDGDSTESLGNAASNGDEDGVL